MATVTKTIEVFLQGQTGVLNADMLGGKHLAGAPKTAYHLIDDQQNIVFAANLPHDGPILSGRCQGPHTLHNRLSDKSGYQIGIFKLNGTLYIMGT